MSAAKPKGLYILDHRYGLIYGEKQRAEIESLVDIYHPMMTGEQAKASPKVLEDMEVLFSGWVGPSLDLEFLTAAKNLKAVFYAGGSVRGLVTDAFWAREISLAGGYGANAVPVAEYTLSQILFSLKLGWQTAHLIKAEKNWPDKKYLNEKAPGCYGSTVGLVSLGAVAQYLCRLLRNFDVNVIAYDPFMTQQQADSLKVKLCPLEDVFVTANVVSIHTPLLDETAGLITGEHILSMKPNSTLINTSRGKITRQKELIDVMRQRPDMIAVLDVVDPEPPQADDEILALNNVITTPHISGSLSVECTRMADMMIQELKRYLNNEPMQWQIYRDQADLMA